MNKLTLDVKERETRRRRAGRILGRTAPLRKHGAAALGESPQRFSQRARGHYPQLDVAYSMVEDLARFSRTNPTPIGSDMITYGTEVAFGDFDTPALLRELSIRIEALRDGAEAAMEVVGIVALLAERGMVPSTEDK